MSGPSNALRLHVVEQAMVVPLQTHGCSVQDAYKRLVQTNVVSLIEAHTKRRQKSFEA